MADDKLPAVSRSGLQDAYRAATLSLWLAAASIVAAGLGLWLPNFLGPWALATGLIVWLLAWLMGMLLAIIGLRNAGSSSRPQQARRRAVSGLIAGTLSLVLVALLILGLIIAIQQLT